MWIILILAAWAMTLQGPEPWLGTWSLNLAKSTNGAEARYKRGTTKIEPWQGGLKVTYDLVGTRGGVTHMEWTGKFDGNDYPMQGSDYVLTNAYSRIDERSYRIVMKADGTVTATATVVISPDGNTLTTQTTGKDAQGKTVSTTTVYERQ
jgi:hypothetical protein